MWKNYILSPSVEETLELLGNGIGTSRLIAGATDLILEIERGVRSAETIIDVSRIPGQNQITLDHEGMIHLGCLVTHADCIASTLLQQYAYPLVKAASEVGSPQIRNRGTIAGNIITASPANDTITPLMALGAKVRLRSREHERIVSLSDFYLGVRKTVMNADEMLIEIIFPAMQNNQRGTFIKLALRNAQAISIVNIAAIITFDQAEVIQKASITLGAVAPTIIHAAEAEAFLCGKTLDEATIQQASEYIASSAMPISDVRASASYRKFMTQVIGKRALLEIAKNSTHKTIQLPLLRGKSFQPPAIQKVHVFNNPSSTIVTSINGEIKEFRGSHQKSLLRLLREDGWLTGTKEGCAEGECGACTVFLDGMAVMSCMVPAGRAHGAEIITIEGIGSSDRLHPVQEAFIETGAVQCGYCTPGFIMSAVKLLEETDRPQIDTIKQAITGNLCRCTGYYKIIEAIELAATKNGS
ncbi:aerobic-type carbon monoxide dehydrogenase, middle subunit CoxM/CutM homologs [Anaerolinea thermolimosa]|uniref:FAD binding domain-containing protein n=1 Tax=Anaerolinea thermolimosa TaxID=229919 RepID=UPI0009FC0B21|nr:FAD binding domain-containing protein [Anaerolinea thermolimosa]GAP06367.1 aerobic-type carbon monoxide dehydrogenase, middle subunit CoxM/CutM homologs [Anaerolinea thermolimosa]